MDDFDFDIGIDPGSIDYEGFGSDMSNADIDAQIGGGDWDYGSLDSVLDNSGQGAFSQLAAAEEPLAQIAEEKDIAGMDKLARAASKMDTRDAFQKLFNLRTGADGSTDWLNPDNLGKIIKLGLGIGNMLGTKKGSEQSGTATAAQQAMAVQRQLQEQARNSWTPQQSQWSNQFFQTPVSPTRGVQYASEMRSPIVPSRNFAAGGGVEDRGFGSVGDTRYGGGGGGFQQVVLPQDIFSRTRRHREQDAGLQDFTPQVLQRGRSPRTPVEPVPITDLLRSLPMLFKSLGFQDDAPPQQFAGGGQPLPEGQGALTATAPFVGYVEGAEGGQSDLIDAKLSPGEYVWDADSVSALGDGNNAAGAARLDEMRMAIREHKRSAPPDEIPPSIDAMTGGQ